MMTQLPCRNMSFFTVSQTRSYAFVPRNTGTTPSPNFYSRLCVGLFARTGSSAGARRDRTGALLDRVGENLCRP